MQSSADTVSVVLVAPQMIRCGLRHLIDSLPGFHVSGEAADLAGACEALYQGGEIFLADWNDACTPETLLQFLADRDRRIVLLTGTQASAALDTAVLAGVKGIVQKSDSAATLLGALKAVHRGELWVDRRAIARIFMDMSRQKADPDFVKIASLTQREREAVAALTSDTAVPCKVIASRLCMSEHTLRNHLTSIYSKLNLTNRLDLFAFATRNHLVGHHLPAAGAGGIHIAPQPMGRRDAIDVR
ncbi:MAG TPA: response regulator transcription factor [Ramlibacter sp.]|nr:response regulator transcription factor [Ramlibacter sp.]